MAAEVEIEQLHRQRDMASAVSRAEDAKRITQPVLAVVGALSLELDPIWGERQQLLLDWLPNVEPFVLPRATHMLEVQNPRGIAEGLAAFFVRHSLTVAA